MNQSMKYKNIINHKNDNNNIINKNNKKIRHNHYKSQNQ